MKKSIYFCVILVMSMSLKAQVDINDKNWDTLFFDDFSGNRSWSNLWEDQNTSDPNYSPIWICFSDNFWNDGVTCYNTVLNKPLGYHAYQKGNAVFGTDHTMKLIFEFKSNTPMSCDRNHVSDTLYSPAPWYKYCHFCNSEHIHNNIHYYSGTIETINPVGFGYYEIECKMPVHDFESSAFWFWSVLGGTYNEIDVFEHSDLLCDGNLERGTLSGIWYNPLGINYYQNNDIPGAQRIVEHLQLLPIWSTTVEEYHRYGCLWMPEHVVWYIDGRVVNECNNPGQIPQFPMWLKITHYGNGKMTDIHGNFWEGTDEMTINYVKAYRLKTNCNEDVVIRNLMDFSAFEFSTKHSIVMGGTNSSLVIPNNSNFTMRAVESITIDGAFELPQGAKMTLLVHDCPECSMEGVVLPVHNCGMENDNK